MDAAGRLVPCFLVLGLLSILTNDAYCSSGGQSQAIIYPSGPSKAYSVRPNSTDQLEKLRIVQTLSHDLKLIWKDNMMLGEYMDVIVPHDGQALFEKLLKVYKLGFVVTSDNVEKLIDEESEQHNYYKQRRLSDEGDFNKTSSFERTLSDQELEDYKTSFELNKYHSYTDIVKFLKYLKWRYYYMVDLIDLGTTFEGRVIQTIKIGHPVEDSTKRAIWIDGGIHAREWASISTAMYFINLLTTQYDLDPEVREYVHNFTWYITPVLNPDGYEYSRSVKSVQVRFWRKNRSYRPEYCTPPKSCCVGVDLNRNFDFFWNSYTNNKRPCSEDFRGPWAFSENETRAVRDFMYQQARNIDAYITLHTYSQFWVYPYGHRASVYPRDVDDLKAVALSATEALRKLHGTVYKIGSGADLLYSAAGGSEDWIKSKMKIKYAYLLELRPKDTFFGHGFAMHPRYLKPIGEETWEGVKVVADAAYQYNEDLKNRRRKRRL